MSAVLSADPRLAELEADARASVDTFERLAAGAHAAMLAYLRAAVARARLAANDADAQRALAPLHQLTESLRPLLSALEPFAAIANQLRPTQSEQPTS